MPTARRRAAALATLLALVMLALAGCGDDRLSADELRKQATAICERANRAMDTINVPNAPAGAARFLREGIAQLRPATRALAALKPPEELDASYARAVALARRELRLIVSHERAIRGGDDVIASFRRLQRQIDPLTAESNRLWRSLGIPACVRL